MSRLTGSENVTSKNQNPSLGVDNQKRNKF